MSLSSFLFQEELERRFFFSFFILPQAIVPDLILGLKKTGEQAEAWRYQALHRS